MTGIDGLHRSSTQCRNWNQFVKRFHLYLQTKLSNPHYPPETCVKVTLLNFTVNQSGLEDQLLGIVVQKERPDLQQAKEQLVIQNAKMKNELKGIEDDLMKI